MCDARLMPQVTSSRRMDLCRPAAAAAVGGQETAYTPKLKKVLKTYQQAATTSLMGPTSYQSSWSSPSPPSSSAKSSSSTTSSSSSSCGASQPQPPPPPPTKVPLIVPPDDSRCDWAETLLNGEVISCFVIGGEMRLCLPQVLNSVLKNSIEEINAACADLQVFCSRCTPDQLAILKRKGILPLEASSCGLITKTDAERLVAALVDRDPPKLADLRKQLTDPVDQMLSVAVFHDCFGKTRGLYRPDLYATPVSACIQCCECEALFPPHKFVAHSHQPRSRTCLWGFDSLNWRSYLLLAKDQSRANNVASDPKSQVIGCCAAHRSAAAATASDSDDRQQELDRLMDQMRKRFDLHHQTGRQHAAATTAAAAVSNAKLNSVSPVSSPAKRKEKEVSESASRDEHQSAKRLKPLDPPDLPVPSFLPPHHMFYPNLLPIWSSYPSAAHLATHPSLPEHLFQLSYNQSSPSPLSAAVPPISRHDQQAQLHNQSDSESQRDQVHRMLHKLTTLLVTLPQNELDDVCSSLRLTLDRIQGPQKEMRRHSASVQRVSQYR